MYERFTDRARKVMQLANQEAQRFNHEYIGTEHVLLGLVKEGSGVASNVLKNLNIDLRNIRIEIEKVIQSGPDMVTMGKLPQTPRTKACIEKAIEIAREWNHNYVGTEHILMALVKDPDSVAHHILVRLGLTADSVSKGVLDLLQDAKSKLSEISGFKVQDVINAVNTDPVNTNEVVIIKKSTWDIIIKFLMEKK